MKGLKKNHNIYIRNGIIWIDYQQNNIRIRRSTGLKNCSFALTFVKKHYSEFIGSVDDKREIIKLYRKLEDDNTIKQIQKSETKQKKKKAHIKQYVDDRRSIYYICKAIFNEKLFLKASTIASYRNIIKLFLEFCATEKLIYADDYKREHNVSFLRYFMSKNICSRYLKRVASFAKSVFNYAVENDYIVKNVFMLPKVKKEIFQNEFEVFSLDEVLNLIKCATGELRTFLVIAFFTGARTGEILALTYDDLDFIKCEIRISKNLAENGILDSPKTISSNRIIDMLDIVKNELIKLKLKQDERIFKKRRFVLRHNFHKLLSSLGYKKRRLYDTRHTFASIMLSRGEEPMWVGCKMLGHKDLNQTYETYAKYLPQNVKARAKFLNNVEI
ncbi:site-specific integrase [Campylobacter sp. faydin G-140]|nr:site-specific integrase [Campylobacter anatolicus]